MACLRSCLRRFFLAERQCPDGQSLDRFQISQSIKDERLITRPRHSVSQQTEPSGRRITFRHRPLCTYHSWLVERLGLGYDQRNSVGVAHARVAYVAGNPTSCSITAANRNDWPLVPANQSPHLPKTSADCSRFFQTDVISRSPRDDTMHSKQ